MKKLLGIVVLGLLLSGCFAEMKTKYRQDIYNAFNEKNCDMSSLWYAYAWEPGVPMQAVVECYKKKPVYRLCTEWDFVYVQFMDDQERLTKLRSAISKALIAKNEDPLKCRNPNNDNKVKLEKELQKAKRRAAAAEAEAAEAKAASQQRSCTSVKTLNPSGVVYWKKVCN